MSTSSWPRLGVERPWRQAAGRAPRRGRGLRGRFRREALSGASAHPNIVQGSNTAVTPRATALHRHGVRGRPSAPNSCASTRCSTSNDDPLRATPVTGSTTPTGPAWCTATSSRQPLVNRETNTTNWPTSHRHGGGATPITQVGAVRAPRLPVAREGPGEEAGRRRTSTRSACAPPVPHRPPAPEYSFLTELASSSSKSRCSDHRAAADVPPELDEAVRLSLAASGSRYARRSRWARRSRRACTGSPPSHRQRP